MTYKESEWIMAIKWNYVFGTTTIVLIVGGTAYAIYKANQAKKAEEESIDLEEAKDIVARRQESGDTVHFVKDIEEVGNVTDSQDIEAYSEPRKIQVTKVSAPELDATIEYDEGIEELMEDDDVEDYRYDRVNARGENPMVEALKDFIYTEEGIDAKEDTTLRFEQNSTEAKHQFIRMELADWHHDHDIYRIMLQLFEFPFIPTTDGDELLRTQVIDYKVQFFGWGSKWNKEVSYSDIILHYARAATFNCGEVIPYWVEYFLSFNELEWDSTSQQIDKIIMRLNSHSYFNEERQTFGLFGLSRESMDQAIRTANRNVDRTVTYEIEFNEFLKSSV
mgnify:FL=1